MQIDFYVTDEPKNKVTKALTNKKESEGTLRAQTSVMYPVFTIEDSGAIVGYNYCYIPAFKRYYYINDIKALRANLFELTLKVDVLMSYRNDIRRNTAIIDRTQNGGNANVYVENGTFLNTSREETKTYNFSGGFNDSPEYILITAGGIA